MYIYSVERNHWGLENCGQAANQVIFLLIVRSRKFNIKVALLEYSNKAYTLLSLQYSVKSIVK